MDIAQTQTLVYWIIDAVFLFAINDPKLDNMVSFPVLLEPDYVPRFQFLEPPSFIIPPGVDPLVVIAVCHVSWVLKSILGLEAVVKKHSSEALLTCLFYDAS